MLVQFYCPPLLGGEVVAALNDGTVDGSRASQFLVSLRGQRCTVQLISNPESVDEVLALSAFPAASVLQWPVAAVHLWPAQSAQLAEAVAVYKGNMDMWEGHCCAIVSVDAEQFPQPGRECPVVPLTAFLPPVPAQGSGSAVAAVLGSDTGLQVFGMVPLDGTEHPLVALRRVCGVLGLCLFPPDAGERGAADPPLGTSLGLPLGASPGAVVARGIASWSRFVPCAGLVPSLVHVRLCVQRHSPTHADEDILAGDRRTNALCLRVQLAPASDPQPSLGLMSPPAALHESALLALPPPPGLRTPPLRLLPLSDGSPRIAADEIGSDGAEFSTALQQSSPGFGTASGLSNDRDLISAARLDPDLAAHLTELQQCMQAGLLHLRHLRQTEGMLNPSAFAAEWDSARMDEAMAHPILVHLAGALASVAEMTYLDRSAGSASGSSRHAPPQADEVMRNRSALTVTGFLPLILDCISHLPLSRRAAVPMAVEHGIQALVNLALCDEAFVQIVEGSGAIALAFDRLSLVADDSNLLVKVSRLVEILCHRSDRAKGTGRLSSSSDDSVHMQVAHCQGLRLLIRSAVQCERNVFAISKAMKAVALVWMEPRTRTDILARPRTTGGTELSGGDTGSALADMIEGLEHLQLVLSQGFYFDESPKTIKEIGETSDRIDALLTAMRGSASRGGPGGSSRIGGRTLRGQGPRYGRHATDDDGLGSYYVEATAGSGRRGGGHRIDGSARRADVDTQHQAQIDAFSGPVRSPPNYQNRGSAYTASVSPASSFQSESPSLHGGALGRHAYSGSRNRKFL